MPVSYAPDPMDRALKTAEIISRLAALHGQIKQNNNYEFQNLANMVDRGLGTDAAKYKMQRLTDTVDPELEKKLYRDNLIGRSDMSWFGMGRGLPVFGLGADESQGYYRTEDKLGERAADLVQTPNLNDILKNAPEKGQLQSLLANQKAAEDSNQQNLDLMTKMGGQVANEYLRGQGEHSPESYREVREDPAKLRSGAAMAAYREAQDALSALNAANRTGDAELAKRMQSVYAEKIDTYNRLLQDPKYYENLLGASKAKLSAADSAVGGKILDINALDESTRAKAQALSALQEELRGGDLKGDALATRLGQMMKAGQIDEKTATEIYNTRTFRPESRMNDEQATRDAYARGGIEGMALETEFQDASRQQAYDRDMLSKIKLGGTPAGPGKKEEPFQVVAEGGQIQTFETRKEAEDFARSLPARLGASVQKIGTSEQNQAIKTRQQLEAELSETIGGWDNFYLNPQEAEKAIRLSLILGVPLDKRIMKDEKYAEIARHYAGSDEAYNDWKSGNAPMLAKVKRSGVRSRGDRPE